MVKINFKKIQLPFFFIASIYLLISIWFFSGVKFDLGKYSSKGFNLGIDFKGGLVHQVTVYSGIEQEEIRTFANESGLGSEVQRVLTAENKKIGNEASYLIRATLSKEEMDLIDKDTSLTPSNFYSKKINIFYAKIKEKKGDRYIIKGEELKKANEVYPDIMTGEIVSEKTNEERVVENVVKESENIISPSYSAGLRKQVIFLILFVLGIILLYVTIRFKFEFALGGIFALFHDVIVILGFLSIFKIEVDYSIVAAILFIIGYSINDTIVIFDRVRENMGILKESALKDVINISINQTLGRSIITSVTTFLASMALVLWGGPKISGFALTISVGIFFGAYSSIFIAAPIVELWHIIFDKKKRRVKEVKQTIKEAPAVSNTADPDTNTAGVHSNLNTTADNKLQLSKKQLKKLLGKKK